VSKLSVGGVGGGYRFEADSVPLMRLWRPRTKSDFQSAFSRQICVTLDIINNT